MKYTIFYFMKRLTITLILSAITSLPAFATIKICGKLSSSYTEINWVTTYSMTQKNGDQIEVVEMDKFPEVETKLAILAKKFPNVCITGQIGTKNGSKVLGLADPGDIQLQ